MGRAVAPQEVGVDHATRRLVDAAESVCAARARWKQEGGGDSYRRLVAALAVLDRATKAHPASRR